MGFEKNAMGTIKSVGGIQLFEGVQSTQNATQQVAGLMSPEDKTKLDNLKLTGTQSMPYATQDMAGLMSAEDKVKLDNIQFATVNTAGLMSAEDKIKLDNMQSAQPATQDMAGLMSAEDKYKLDNIQVATQDAAGLMTPEDKFKLDNIHDMSYATQEEAGLMSAEDKFKLDGIQFATTEFAGLMTPEDKAKLNDIQITENATQDTAGLMSAEDKAKLDNLQPTRYATQEEAGLMPPEDKAKLDGISYATEEYAGLMLPEDKIKLNSIKLDDLDSFQDLTGHIYFGHNTLKDFGIEDVTLKDGTISIAGNQITPLTAASPLATDKLVGIIDMKNLPASAMERCVVVDDDTARFALTTNDVQKGDTVKVVNPTPTMYMVVDEDNLDNAAGYVVYSAGNANSVPWSGITGKPATYYTLPPADINTLGGIMVGANLSIAPDGTLSTHAPYVLPEATANTLGGVKIGANIEVQSDGTISVPNATANVAGVVKAGNNINIGADGTISGIAYNLSVATTTELGGIKIGQNVETLGDGTLNIPIASELKAGVVKLGGNITVDSDGVLNAPAYQLPTATALRLGGIKVGKYLSVDSEGLLNATGVPTVATKKDLGGVIIGDNVNVDGDGKISVTLPDKLSQLSNDTGFITSENLSNHNEDSNAHRDLFSKVNNSVTNTFKSVSSLAPNLKRNTSYKVNDCASSPSLPNWGYLKCTRAGTTSDIENNFSEKKSGDIITDGSTVWLVKELGSNDEATNTNNAAAAPNYYERSECYKAKGSSAAGRRTIVTPANLWLNVNNAGYGLAASKELDLSKDSTWSANAQKWQANHAYEVDDVVYPLSGKTSYYYRCVTAGTSSSLEPTFPTTLGEKYNDGNCQWICELDYTLASNRAGRDFYIFIGVNPDKSLKTCISANSTVPYGYTADTSRKVGGFHCLCADVGTISGHKLSGYVQGDILPASVWDLNHRPKSEPEGMVYIDGLDIWVDIYLCSWTGSTANKNLKTISKYGAVTGDGTSAEKFHALKWEQTMGEQNKRLPWVREFRIFSVGSNQSTNIKGSADVNTTGGHVDTAGRRMISNYGIEDCCGFLWQWNSDVGSASTSASRGNGFDANDRSDVKGQIYGAEYRPLVGGCWADVAFCGSRSAGWYYGSLSLLANCGARGASEPVGRNA